MANIQIVNKIIAGNQQDNWNQANGHNVFTLYDEELDMPKFILIVSKYILGVGVTEVGRMTKYPNEDGYAHFDIQGLLRGNLGYEKDEPEKLGTVDESLIMFNIQAGYLDDSTQGYTITDISPFGLAQDYYITTNGTKRRDELIWSWEDYSTHMTQTLFETAYIYDATSELAKPLSDYVEDVSGIGSCITGATTFRNFNIGTDEDLTLSFINRAYFDSYESDICIGAVGIRTWWFEFVSADGNTREVIAIPNTTGNGGGPWTSWSTAQGVYLNDKYNISRVQCGNSNPELTTLWNGVYDGTYAFVYVCGTSHKFPQMYESQFISVPPQCVIDSGMESYWDIQDNVVMTETVKLTYVPDDCNDFDHVQVKWKNTFGLDDYFTFTKRDDEVVNINRTTYNKTNPDWTANTFSVDLTNRGKVNITNKFNYTGTLRTKYLTDDEQLYLKNLLMSTEVQAKIDGEWKPIVVTNATWNKRTFRTDRLFQLELQYELASPALPQIG